MCIYKSKRFLETFRATSTEESNEELNLKTCNFKFFFLQLQHSKEKNSQNSYSIREKLFLHVYVEIAKIKLPLPTTIFIAVGQQFFFFFKNRRKESCFFFNLVLCLTFLLNLEKQESIILWLINNIGCVN